ncbi:MAG: RHS repeat domain-containing protein [Candidatus Coprovivens sp.]
MFYFFDDNIGNPLTIGNKTLTWMNGRELSSYQDSSNNISYKYNLNGIRTSKVVNNIETKYYLEGNKIVFEDRNNTMLYYLYNGDELLGFVYNGNTYYYHKNVFGDIIGIINSNYEEIVTYEYDSWGAISNITDNSGINLGTINPFRYRSYYYDEETKLYYLNSRYYNPEWGRFINGDIILGGNELISNNIFSYCENVFIDKIDSKGNFALPAIAIKVGIKALIGAAVNGLSQIVANGINGRPKFENVGKAMAVGALSGAVSGFVGVKLQNVPVTSINPYEKMVIENITSNVTTTYFSYQAGISTTEETAMGYLTSIPLSFISANNSQMIDDIYNKGISRELAKQEADFILGTATSNYKGGLIEGDSNLKNKVSSKKKSAKKTTKIKNGSYTPYTVIKNGSYTPYTVIKKQIRVIIHL